MLCPNCHRVVHETNIVELPSIAERIGDSWKEHYFSEGTKSEAVRKQISEGMKKAHAEGRSSVYGHRKLEATPIM